MKVFVKFPALLLLFLLSFSLKGFAQKDSKMYSVQIADGLSEKKLLVGKLNIKGENLSDSQTAGLGIEFAKGNRIRIVEAKLLRTMKRCCKRVNGKKVSMKIEAMPDPKEVSVLILIE